MDDDDDVVIGCENTFGPGVGAGLQKRMHTRGNAMLQVPCFYHSTISSGGLIIKHIKLT